MTVVAEGDACNTEGDYQPVPLTQAELNDLIRGLNFSKESAQLLDSRLKKKYLLAPGTKLYWYRVCKKELRPFFIFQNMSSLVYCNNIAELIKSMGLTHDALEW